MDILKRLLQTVTEANLFRWVESKTVAPISIGAVAVAYLAIIYFARHAIMYDGKPLFINAVVAALASACVFWTPFVVANQKLRPDVATNILFYVNLVAIAVCCWGLILTTNYLFPWYNGLGQSLMPFSEFWTDVVFAVIGGAVGLAAVCWLTAINIDAVEFSAALRSKWGGTALLLLFLTSALADFFVANFRLN